MSDTKRAVEKFDLLLLEAIENGQEGDYALCSAIVEAFRVHKGDDKAKAVRRVLWSMIRESKHE